MDTSPSQLDDLADFLQTELAVNRFSNTEQGGIYYPSKRPVRRIGLALETFSKLSNWVQEMQIDAFGSTAPGNSTWPVFRPISEFCRTTYPLMKR